MGLIASQVVLAASKSVAYCLQVGHRTRIAMIPDAFTHDEQPAYAGDYTTHEWDRLKRQSLENRFAFKMGRCSSRAVLKTSINGLQFFAHYSDECATAPETKWHIAGSRAHRVGCESSQ